MLYTCLVVRDVHIEVAHNLNTDSFLNSSRQFIARRGSLELIRSENGSNFESGERQLNRSIKGWNQGNIANFLLQRNVQWAFSPPCGPWEHCIRTVSKVLNVLVRVQGLSTFMCKAESIVNGTPLTKGSDDVRDLEPSHLITFFSFGTANHFLLESLLEAQVEAGSILIGCILVQR